MLKKKYQTLLLLVCFSIAKIYTQTNPIAIAESRVNKRKVIITDKQGYTTEAELTSLKIYPKIKKVYTWYWKDTIVSTQGSYEGMLLNGKCIVYNAQKQLLKKIFYRDGVKHGYEYRWNNRGSLVSIHKWTNGRLNRELKQGKIEKKQKTVKDFESRNIKKAKPDKQKSEKSKKVRSEKTEKKQKQINENEA